MIRVRYEFHPLAEIFPLMEGAEFAALALDIREHGLREPIILHEGKILDGRNRYRACIEANVNPKTEPWDQEGTAHAFVLSKNLHRRHLNTSQRAMIAARLAGLRDGEHKSSEKVSEIGYLSQEEAAGLLNVGRTTVSEARIVQDEGTSEEKAAVEQGHANVSNIARRIRAKTGPKKGVGRPNKAPMSQTGKNPERIQRQQVNAEIWNHIKDALVHLTSLPLPADVAAIARAHDKTGLVDARLAQSQKWLEEFADVWRQRRQDAA